jgi:hypothetical protein
MTTSGTAAFNLNLAELVEEAYERAGLQMRSGYDMRTARRSLNLLTIEWANKGINLWCIEEGQITMVTGQATYDLPIDTIDLLDQVIRTNAGSQPNQTDINITRISESTYSTIPNKLAQGRPIQVWINRQSGAVEPVSGVAYPQINVWPTPNDPGSQYTFVYWRLRRIQDAGTGVTTQDIPFRFLNAMVAGLALYIAMKKPEVSSDRIMMLKGDYDAQFQLAADEDREKASIRFVPRSLFY